MWEYSEKLKDHFLNPRNVGEIEDPDAVGEVGNIACGDLLKLTLRIERETERIVEAKFKTFGCASAIASSSALTELIQGKTLDEALKISNNEIAAYLEGLPEAKMHCSVMGRDALEEAVAGYRSGRLPSAERAPSQNGEIVCNCFGVSRATIERVIVENHLTENEQVTHYCKAGGGCGTCREEIDRILAEVCSDGEGIAAQRPRDRRQKGALTNIEKMRRIMETIEREIRPRLRKDGGDIELVDIEGDKVLVTLRGACSMCAGAGFTLKSFVQTTLQEFVTEEIVVEEVK